MFDLLLNVSLEESKTFNFFHLNEVRIIMKVFKPLNWEIDPFICGFRLVVIRVNFFTIYGQGWYAVHKGVGPIHF